MTATQAIIKLCNKTAYIDSQPKLPILGNPDERMHLLSGKYLAELYQAGRLHSILRVRLKIRL
jgi:hypothetical protein